MKTKASLLLAAILAVGSTALSAGAQQVNPRNPSDSRAFDVMETDQGPPTAADRQYAKPKHKKHGKKAHKSAETQPYDASSSGTSGTQGTTSSGTDVNPAPLPDDMRNQPDREIPPDQPRIDR